MTKENHELGNITWCPAVQWPRLLWHPGSSESHPGLSHHDTPKPKLWG